MANRIEGSEPVELSYSEMVPGIVVAGLAHSRVLANPRLRSKTPLLDQDGRAWSRRIEATLAEIAVAKYLGAYWVGSDLGIFSGGGGDVSGKVQVRASLRVDPAGMPIYPKDRAEDLFVFVIARAPVFYLVGWIRGSVARGVGRPCDYEGVELLVEIDDLLEVDYLRQEIAA